MAILAIDTSTKACVLGVQVGDEIFVDETILGRTHSEELLPRIDALLIKAGVELAAIELIVYGQGPGSFTGLRIGIGVVQGLAFGLNIPVVGVSTLACLALQSLTQQKLSNQVSSNAPMAANSVMVALSARNTEVYFGAYTAHEGGVVLIDQEGVFEASAIPKQSRDNVWLGIGDGWQFHDALCHSSQVQVLSTQLEVWPKAKDLLTLGLLARDRGELKTAFEALPEYLREQVAVKPASHS